MKLELEIAEEQSKRIFWVIQTIFGFAIGTSLYNYANILIPPYSKDFATVILALVAVYYCVLSSWIDFSYTLIKNPYIFRKNNTKREILEKLRFASDLIIVAFYSYLIAYIEYINAEPYNKHIGEFFIAFALIFILYVISGWLRIIEHGKKASRLTIILPFAVLFSANAIGYYSMHAKYGELILVNRSFIAACILLTASYRIIRERWRNKKYVVAVDVDGVLGNQIHGVLPVIKNEYGIKLEYDDITDWRLKIADTSIDKIIVNQQKQKSYILNMPVHNKAKETIEELNKKYNIAIATARSGDLDVWTKAWLDNNKILYDRYYNTKEGGKHNAEEDFDLLIDDYIGNIIEYLKNHNGKAVLFSQPWNQDRSELDYYIENDRLRIANNWDEVGENVKDLLG